MNDNESKQQSPDEIANDDNETKNNDDTSSNNNTKTTKSHSKYKENDHGIRTLDFNLSAKVEAKLREVIPSDNPLDAADFDAIAHINSLFPTEESLGDVHDGPLAYKIAHIRKEVGQIDLKLSKAVQHAAENRRKTQSAIKETQSSIGELFNKVKSIKQKAVQSEIMVEEICSDIRKLDNAKTNLSDSITALQKLHMLVSGVEQLQKDASTKSYDRAKQLVQALNDLFQYFEPHLSLTQLKSLKLDLEKIREELKKEIYRDFRHFEPNSEIDIEVKKEALRNACEVIDVMGREERDDFVEIQASMQLQAYGAIFAPGGEKSGIEYLDRRFDWLKNQLMKYNKNYARIFPRYWNVPGYICKDFCDTTKKHLDEILNKSQQLNALDMNDLVKALEQCVSFEKELQRLYSEATLSEDLDELRISYKQLLGEYDESEIFGEQANTTMTAEKIKIKYKLNKLRQKMADIEAQQKYENARKSSEQKEKEICDEIKFDGILSSAFDKYMHYYVELEKKSINDVLRDIEKNEQWKIKSLSNVPNEARYGGVDDLLGYIKKSIQRCAKIGTGEIFYKIYFEYRDGIVNYINLLDKHVVRCNSLIANNNKNNRNTSCDLLVLVLVVNTLEYLSDTLEALQHKLRSSMTDEKLKKKVDLNDIRDGKVDDLASKTVKCLSQGITDRIGAMLDREVVQCRRWNEPEQSAERSSFLQSLKGILNVDVCIAHQLLVLTYHNLYNSQMSKRLIPRYVSAIFRIRRISTEAALQLQLDTRDLEKTLLNLPLLGFEDEEDNNSMININDNDDGLGELNIQPNFGKNIRVSNSYKNYIQREIAKVQALLKTIVANYQSIEGIATFFRDVSQNGNAQDLVKICEIKGLKKNEIQTVVSTYNRIVAHGKQAKPLVPPEMQKQRTLSGLFGFQN